MRILLASLLVLVPFLLRGQATTGSVEGYVKDHDQKPVPYANITIKGSALGTTTNENGHFRIRRVPAGEQVLIISAIGYSEYQQTLEVIAGRLTNAAAISLQESKQELSTVTITSNRSSSYTDSKVSQSLRLNADIIEIPQNINIATKQTLRDMGMLSKGEIARISSGITRSYGGSLDMTLQIRGTNATYGTYRNGVGGPIWWNAQEDAAMIERIEFVKGPAGFMLANGEPGGLVNTVTKQPTHESIAEISFGMGAYNMMRTSMDLGGEFVKDGKLTYRLNIGIQKNNEYYQFGAFNRYFICPVLKYDFSKNTSLTIEHNYVNAKAQENTHSSISINGDLWALPADFAINDPNQKKFLGADVYTRVQLRHKLSDQWTLNAQAAHMSTDWDGTTLYLEGISPTRDTLYRASSLADWTGRLDNLQLFLDGKFNTGQFAEHKVLVGIDFGDGTEGSTYGGTWGENKYPLSINNPTYYLPKDSLAFTGDKYSWIATNRWMALYVQDHLKLFDKLILTIAGRFTHLSTGQDTNNPPDDPEYEVTDNKLTPRLGLTYLVSPKISLYVLHDESFLSQRGAIFGGGRLPALTGSNNEIGIKSMLFNSQLLLNASVYDIRKNNVGTTDQLHQGFYLKTGQIRSTGLDFDMNGKITESFSINANYSYVNARITKDTDETLVGLVNNGTAKHLGNLWAKYKIAHGTLQGLGFGAGLQYTGQRSGVWPGSNSMDGNKYLPDYTLLDASVSYNVDKFYVGFNLYNMTNKRYAAAGSWYPDLQEWLYDVGDRINFRLQASIRL